jgi:hypothetical protein
MFSETFEKTAIKKKTYEKIVQHTRDKAARFMSDADANEHTRKRLMKGLQKSNKRLITGGDAKEKLIRKNTGYRKDIYKGLEGKPVDRFVKAV